MQLLLISKHWELGKTDLRTDGAVPLKDYHEVLDPEFPIR